MNSKTTLHTFPALFVMAALIGCSNGSQPSATTANGGLQVQGKDVSASLGGGTTITEAELKVPFYPGSTEKPNESVRIDAATEKMFLTKRLTPDAPEKVAEFYVGKVKGLKFQKYTTSETTNMIGQADLEGGWKIAISANRKAADQETEITVSTGLEVKK